MSNGQLGIVGWPATAATSASGSLWLRWRLGRLIGATSLLIALPMYSSPVSQPILGRWSVAFFSVMVAVAALWLAIVVGVWPRAEAREVTASPYERTRAGLMDIAIALWGLSYLSEAKAAPANAARLLDLNLLGSASPVAALAEWAAVVCAALALVAWWLERGESKWANVGLSGLALATLAVLGEGAARITAFAAPQTEGFPTYRSQVWHRRYVQVNAAGFRDTNHSPSAAPGTRRLLLIGDSFAFGEGIRDVAGRFGEQLGAQLAKGTGERWEVINASRGDLNTLDELAILRRTISYRPDVVVLLYVFNDIDYLYPITERSVLTEHPSSLLERLHPLRLLYLNSYLFQAAYVRYRLLRRRLGDGITERYDPYGDSTLVREHLRDISRFVAIAQRAGARVGIVPFNTAVTLGVAPVRQYDRFVRQGRGVGLPIWSAAHAFSGFKFSELTINALDAHPNELANRLLAQAIAPRVLEEVRRQ